MIEIPGLSDLKIVPSRREKAVMLPANLDSYQSETQVSRIDTGAVQRRTKQMRSEEIQVKIVSRRRQGQDGQKTSEDETDATHMIDLRRNFTSRARLYQGRWSHAPSLVTLHHQMMGGGW